jgi:hypothetical protein
MGQRDRSGLRAAVILLAGIVMAAGLTTPASTLRFLSDDPLSREPETQDASKAAPWRIGLLVDLTTNLFAQPGDPTPGVRAGNVNTIDEVPDSGWFTNRILARPLSTDEVIRGAGTGDGPAPGRWTVTATKDAGVAPGFTIRDAAGETWFISFDGRGHPEAATGALVAANRIFWALGYWQADTVLSRIHPEDIVIADDATIVPMSGKPRPMRRDDLLPVWQQAHRSPDGSYRAAASRRLPGRPLGGFRYHGTRPDDPNDLVPHEHRRELRALQVFGAWTNLVDIKAGNTLDMLVTENGRGVVRHYLQDVGSTFGTGALAPREYDEGWEHVYEGDLLWKRLVTLNLLLKPWHTVPYEDVPAVGRFEATRFDPVSWKPRAPVAALRHAQPDDLFWAARRVTAFSDAMIHTIAGTAGYSDPAATRHLGAVLIQRRDAIGRAYLSAVTPIVNPMLSLDGRLSFENAAVSAGVAPPPRGYQVRWAVFDNATGSLTALGESPVTSDGQTGAPAPLPTAPGQFVRVEIITVDPPQHAPARPVHAYFRRGADRWTLVGLSRAGV